MHCSLLVVLLAVLLWGSTALGAEPGTIDAAHSDSESLLFRISNLPTPVPAPAPTDQEANKAATSEVLGRERGSNVQVTGGPTAVSQAAVTTAATTADTAADAGADSKTGTGANATAGTAADTTAEIASDTAPSATAQTAADATTETTVAATSGSLAPTTPQAAVTATTTTTASSTTIAAAAAVTTDVSATENATAAADGDTATTAATLAGTDTSATSKPASVATVTTVSADSEPPTAAWMTTTAASPVEVPVHLNVAGAASEEVATRLGARPTSAPTMPPPAPTLSRHRAEPGLAPSENKPSSRRNGVPDLEMLENPSKPRKGVPSADAPREPTPAPAAEAAVTQGPTTTLGFFGDVVSAVANDSPMTEGTTGHPFTGESADAPGGTSTSTVVGLIFLVAFFAFAGFFVFRKLRDTWYRRHYRKMDFLVDGMYNL